MKKSAVVICALLGMIWGCSFIFIKWASPSVSPLQISLLRSLCGFAPVMLFGLLRGRLRWAHWRHAHHFLVMALLASALYYCALAKATALLPSGIAGALGGAMPLFTFVCAWLFLPNESLTRMKAFGIGLGLIGVLIIVKPWAVMAAINLAGVGYMMLGAFCIGASFVYARRFLSPLGIPAVALVTYQIGLAAVFLLLVTPLQGITAVFADSRAWIGLTMGLGVLGTGVAYIAYYHLIEQQGAVAASAVTYIPPVVALVIGVLNGEDISPSAGVAIMVILLGVACVQLSDRFASSEAHPASPGRPFRN
ncbi:DMT family transporter [Pseudomonas gingeri]|uniref:DMT family transporter n=1 Tax=Pseudomonas gingeri TaxID=117681 RepID=UPI00159F87EA|nr:DMT family transporter [Pseudomonas gingeri]NWE47538.1 DMT family transporter [Pseudomonas gingeri]